MSIINSNIVESETAPPSYLKEHELIDLMDKHGIGMHVVLRYTLLQPFSFFPSHRALLKYVFSSFQEPTPQWLDIVKQ